MNFKKISSALIIMLGFSIFVIACSSNSSEKNEGPESAQKEAMESKSPDSSVKTPLSTSGISLNNLPAGVKEFVGKNYPGYKMISATSDPLCQGGDAIDVAITKNGSPNLSLIFKPDGSFVQQEEDVPLSTAPGKINSVLKGKYASYSAGNQIEKLTLANKSVQCLVDLNKGKVSKEVIFDLNGNVVCEK
jgi:hypothetical protein